MNQRTHAEMNQPFEGEYAAHVYIGVAVGIDVYVGVHIAEKDG